MSLAEEIRKGMADGEFCVHYQPVCDTATGASSGAEALMRWQRTDGRSISPVVFIRAAEEEGLIVSLTQHLFGLIAEDVRDWQVSAPFRLVLEITERSLVDDTETASADVLA